MSFLRLTQTEQLQSRRARQQMDIDGRWESGGLGPEGEERQPLLSLTCERGGFSVAAGEWRRLTQEGDLGGCPVSPSSDS